MSFESAKNSMIDTLNDIEIDKIESTIKDLSNLIVKCSNKGGKILVCGNGGSAAEAEHFVGELICKFQKVRKPLPALTLHSNIPTVTAIGNDFDFENVFSRNLEALGNENDILIAMSTSGKSKNVINAINMAKEMNIYTFVLLGNDGGDIKDICSHNFIVNSNIVSTIQEIHLMFLHALCFEIDILVG